ncbi:MAG: hypothetical protein IE933_09375 [Sphingomonadales bacterium]|nr:hypothetical protein [Sphingomonadales bacterium]MBD3774976.1 hypothetical protein [Paracoccaceae bacterium]
MGKKSGADKSGVIAASCTLGRDTFPVSVSRLSSGGCRVEADEDWPPECEFLHLSIAGGVEVNGCAAKARGRKADIRFFGQIHPVVVDQLAAAA